MRLRLVLLAVLVLTVGVASASASSGGGSKVVKPDSCPTDKPMVVRLVPRRSENARGLRRRQARLGARCGHAFDPDLASGRKRVLLEGPRRRHVHDLCGAKPGGNGHRPLPV